MPFLDRRWLAGLAFLLLVAFLAGVYYGKHLNTVAAQQADSYEIQLLATGRTQNDAPAGYIEVFVTGAVEESRICRLLPGARVKGEEKVTENSTEDSEQQGNDIKTGK